MVAAKRQSPPPSARPVRRWWRRALKVVAVVLACALALPLLAALLFVGSGATRSRLLNELADPALREVPGQVTVGQIGWPALGHFTLRDVVWTSGAAVPDTVAHVRSLDLHLDLAGLRAGDLKVDSVRTEIHWLDIPVMNRVLAAGTGLPPRPAGPDSAGGRPFLRDGAIPGLPSAAITALQATLTGARLAPGIVVRGAAVRGAVDLAAGAVPALALSGRSARIRLQQADGAGDRVLSCEHLAITASLTDGAAAWRDGRWREGSARVDTLQLVLAGLQVAGRGTLDRGVVDLALDLDLTDADLLATLLGPEAAGAQATFGLALVAAGEVEATGLPATLTGRLVGDLVLPASLEPWVPAPAVPGAGALAGAAGRIELDLDRRAQATRLATAVRLGDPATAGLLLRAEGTVPGITRSGDNWRRGTAVVDTIVAALPGLLLTGAGSLRDGEISADLHAAVSDPDLAARLLGPPAAGVSATADLDLQARGRLDGRGLPAVLSGAVLADVALPDRLDHWALPPAAPDPAALAGSRGRLDLEFARGPGGFRLAAAARLGDPAAAGLLLRAGAAASEDVVARGAWQEAAVEVDTVALALGGNRLSGRGSLAGGEVAARIGLWTRDARWVQPLQPDGTAAQVLEASADITVAGPVLRPQGAFAAGGRLVSGDIDLPDVRISGLVGPDSASAQCVLPVGGGFPGGDIDSLRIALVAARQGPTAWTAGLDLGAWRADRSVTLAARTSAPGPDGTRIVAVPRLRLVAGERHLALEAPATVNLGPGPADVALGPWRMAGDLGTLRVRGGRSAGLFDFAAEVDLQAGADLVGLLAPGLADRDDGVRAAELRGRARITGPVATPLMDGDLILRLLPAREDRPVVGLDCVLGKIAADDAGNGVTAQIALVVADTVALSGRIDLPSGLAGPRTATEPQAAPRVVVSVPEQSLATARLRGFLPVDYGLAGRLTATLDAEAILPGGPDAGVVSLAGRIATPGLQLKLPRRSRLEVAGDLAWTGPVGSGRLAGTVEVRSGFVRLPELPRALLPVEGPSLLRSALPASAAPPPAAASPVLLPDLDVNLRIPGEVRLNGYGVDAALTGELAVRRGRDARGAHVPQTSGELNLGNGTVRFMNRLFRIVRGELEFRGQTPPDPNLDIALETTVGGTVVRVLVGGTALVPEVGFESEPAYPEADIVAILLFGAPLDQLDGDQQTGLDQGSDARRELRQNLAALVMVLGTGGLRESVSGSIGVDMIEVGAGSGGGSTLMLGKYLSPGLLLRYQHSLERSGSYLVTLEYALTRLLRLASTYARGDEASGLELKWNWRY